MSAWILARAVWSTQPNPAGPQTLALLHKSSLKQKGLPLKGSCTIRISLSQKGQVRTPCFFDTSLSKHASVCINLNKYYISWTSAVSIDEYVAQVLALSYCSRWSASQQHGCKVAKLCDTTAKGGGEFRTQLLHPFWRGVSSISKPFSAEFCSPARKGREWSAWKQISPKHFSPSQFINM